MKGNYIPRESLKKGMILVCGDDERQASSCWTDNSHQAIPLRIGSTRSGVDILWLDGRHKTNCDCSDLEHLYEWIDPSTKPSSNLTPSFMSNVLDFFREMTSSKEDKLLKKLGIENPIGTPTELGLKLASEIAYKAHRAEIIKIAEQMDKTSKDE